MCERDRPEYPPVGLCDFLIRVVVGLQTTDPEIQVRECGEPATHFTKDGLVQPRCEEHR